MKDSDEGPLRKVVAVPTSSWRRGDGSLLAQLVGTIRGEQTGPGTCRIWVEDEDGEIVPVVWPAGYRARLGPLELLGADGAVVAVPGTPISVAGGFVPADPADQDGTDEAFYVMEELPPL